MVFKEVFHESSEIKVKENDKSKFDPDKRIEIRKTDLLNSTSSDEVYNPDKRIEKVEPHEDGFYTTFEDRMKCTNLDNSEGGLRGTWSGERGNSKFIPSYEFMKNKLEKYGVDGVEYKNGIVDFSPFVKHSVQIDNMTSDRIENFKQANEKLAEQFNLEKRDGKDNWSARDIDDYLHNSKEKLTRHECNDMKTIEYIPTSIHKYFSHSGGVAECKIRDGINRGGFDE